MPSASELIARNKELLKRTSLKKSPVGKSKPPPEKYDEYSFKLPWKGMHYWILTPPGFEWSDTIRNYCLGEVVSGEGILLGDTIIIHGHSRDERCFARHQCHALGYKPTGDEPKPFLEKWKRFGYQT